jgi:pre-mRNA-processing factor 19
LQTVRIWQQSEDGNYNCIRTLKDHTAEVSI